MSLLEEGHLSWAQAQTSQEAEAGGSLESRSSKPVWAIQHSPVSEKARDLIFSMYRNPGNAKDGHSNRIP